MCSAFATRVALAIGWNECCIWANINHHAITNIIARAWSNYIIPADQATDFINDKLIGLMPAYVDCKHIARRHCGYDWIGMRQHFGCYTGLIRTNGNYGNNRMFVQAGPLAYSTDVCPTTEGRTRQQIISPNLLIPIHDLWLDGVP